MSAFYQEKKTTINKSVYLLRVNAGFKVITDEDLLT
jgi:hypothetical protein